MTLNNCHFYSHLFAFFFCFVFVFVCVFRVDNDNEKKIFPVCRPFFFWCHKHNDRWTVTIVRIFFSLEKKTNSKYVIIGFKKNMASKYQLYGYGKND